LVPELPGLAVIGCGHWGKNLVRNAANLHVLRAAVDPRPAARTRAAEICPTARLYLTLDEALSDTSVRADRKSTRLNSSHRL